jgi:hypothetical protein
MWAARRSISVLASWICLVYDHEMIEESTPRLRHSVVVALGLTVLLWVVSFIFPNLLPWVLGIDLSWVGKGIDSPEKRDFLYRRLCDVAFGVTWMSWPYSGIVIGAIIGAYLVRDSTRGLEVIGSAIIGAILGSTVQTALLIVLYIIGPPIQG